MRIMRRHTIVQNICHQVQVFELNEIGLGLVRTELFKKDNVGKINSAALRVVG